MLQGGLRDSNLTLKSLLYAQQEYWPTLTMADMMSIPSLSEMALAHVRGT